jgi:hypothetical protein
LQGELLCDTCMTLTGSEWQPMDYWQVMC